MREEVIGDCRLILGDCREVLPGLTDVDHVITDPPYGKAATHKGHLSTITLRNGEPARQALGFDGISGDELVDFAKQWTALARRWVIFTCEWKDAHRLDESGILIRLGIWRKPDGSPQFTGDRPGTGWEAVAICHRRGRKRWNGGGHHAFWSVPKGSGVSGHPTEKPAALVGAWVRDFTDWHELVLDPYCGSGTTGVVCVATGRRFIGIEKDPQHFDTACRRIEAAYKQPRLFAEPAPKPEQAPLL